MGSLVDSFWEWLGVLIGGKLKLGVVVGHGCAGRGDFDVYCLISYANEEYGCN